MLHAFFWVIPWRLNFIRQRFRTFCLSEGRYEEISSYLPTYEDGTDSVPKRWRIKFRCQGITQKKAHNTLSLPKRPAFSLIIIVCLSHVVLTCYAKGINKNNFFQQSMPLHQAPYLISYSYWLS